MEKYLDFINTVYKFNRTINSKDNHTLLGLADSLIDCDVRYHNYQSGDDIATWIIPPEWNVRSASVSTLEGKVIASYEDHPLFLAPYSVPVSSVISREELSEHISFHPVLDDAFFYEHRLAFDYSRRLKEWRITLPRNLWSTMTDEYYKIDIDVETSSGDMTVAEYWLEGESDEQVFLLADYCHPGQVNDSLSGLVVMAEVFNWLATLKNRKYCYRLLLLPETIGSCVYLHSNPSILDTTRLAIFSEFVGWGKDWIIKRSVGDESLSDKIAKQISIIESDLNLDLVQHHEAISNDELIFDHCGISSMSLLKSDILEYHSDKDHPSRLNVSDLSKAVSIIKNVVNIIESDKVLKPLQRVPIYLTRFDLYYDMNNDFENWNLIRQLLKAIDGKKSLLDISNELGASFFRVHEVSEKLLHTNQFASI